MSIIRKKNFLGAQTVASQILSGSDRGRELVEASQIVTRTDHGGEPVKNGGEEDSFLTATACAMFFHKRFIELAANSLQSHLQTFRTFNANVIPHSIQNGEDFLEIVRRRRDAMDVLGPLFGFLAVEEGDPGWKQRAHQLVRKVVLELSYNEKLDDHSMAGLIQLPGTTSAACSVLEACFRYGGDNLLVKNFSTSYGETMSTLLSLVHDDATPTATQISVVPALLAVLDHESEETILTVATRFTEFLTNDFDASLQIAVASLFQSFMSDVMFTMAISSGLLNALMDLIVSRKDYEVRRAAGQALVGFSEWKRAALVIAALPGALQKLFGLFFSTPSTQTSWGYNSVANIAGEILASLLQVEENRTQFRVLANAIDGLGEILAGFKETWQETREEMDRVVSVERASIAASIVGNLALHKELRQRIVAVPGLREGLQFLQLISIAEQHYYLFNFRTESSWMLHRGTPVPASRALVTACYSSINPSLTEVPALHQVQAVMACADRPPERFLKTYCHIYLSRAIAHTEMGAYKAALANLALAQQYSDRILKTTKSTFLSHLRSVRMLLQAKMGDCGAASVGANQPVEKAQSDYLASGTALLQRGIVKQMSGDLGGALSDLDEACQLYPYEYHVSLFVVKYGAGARADAQAAQNDRYLEEGRNGVRSYCPIGRFFKSYLKYVESS